MGKTLFSKEFTACRSEEHDSDLFDIREAFHMALSSHIFTTH